MIARGAHIKTVNEEFSIRKSDGGFIVLPDDSPMSAAAGASLPGEATEAITRSFGNSRPRDIDDLIKANQKKE